MKNVLANIEQNAIAQIDRVVESKQQDRRAVSIGKVFKDALSRKSGLSILTHRSDGCLLVGTRAIHGNKRVDVSG